MCQCSTTLSRLFYTRSSFLILTFSNEKSFFLLHFDLKIFCCLSIAYLCLCAYYTIFRMRIFNYFYLSLYHLTDENSLIFAATFLCRLTAPLSYNFLGMIHMDQAIIKKTIRHQTVFTTVRRISSSSRIEFVVVVVVLLR